jgi:signal transduction histidine kinase/methyl-accepting chemotaxis protein
MQTNLSIGQRTALGFALMIALVLVASVIGYFYTQSVEVTVNTNTEAVNELQAVADLQLSWLTVVATIDNMLLTRQTSLIDQQLNAQLADFNNRIDSIEAQMAGMGITLIADLRALDQLGTLGGELSDVVGELTTLSEEGRWARAQIVRHTELASLQRRLNDLLGSVSDDIEASVTATAAEAVSAKNAIRTYFVITAALAVVVGAVAGYLTTRSITNPVAALVKTTRAIAAGDLSQRADVSSHDEIGVLAASFNRMTEQLRDLIDNLETRVSSRTRDLQVAADVSREITTVMNPTELLSQVVELTRGGFNLYSTSIFLHDEATNRLNLAAGTGEAGEEMLAKGKHFDLYDPHGLVPRAGRTRQAVVANDVTASPDYAFNPLLPDTRSEMTLPMQVGTRLIGVLDLQAAQKDRFSDDDLRVLTTLAEQIAVAVRNAQLYAEAQQARQIAEDANKVKSQFLANMSHELRTPLNAILNFTEIVADGVLGEVNDKQVDALQKAVASGDHLLSLINDVLDITKIEVGMMELFIEDVDLNAVLKSVLSTSQGLLKDKPEVQLVTDIDENLPTIAGDKRRLRQILINLLSNAVKFTPSGTIRLTAKNRDGEVFLSVQDSGVGIAPEDLPIIFETFRQTRHGLADRTGTGLGLPISKHFAEAHGGRLWVESTVDVGSTFYVTIPVETRRDVTLSRLQANGKTV